MMDGNEEGLHLTTIMDQGDISADRQSVLSTLSEGRRAGRPGTGTLFAGPAPNPRRSHYAVRRAVCHCDDVFHRHHLQYPVSLSGLALGIGMLVDNSVVVIGIYSLRGPQRLARRRLRFRVPVRYPGPSSPRP